MGYPSGRKDVQAPSPPSSPPVPTQLAARRGRRWPSFARKLTWMTREVRGGASVALAEASHAGRLVPADREVSGGNVPLGCPFGRAAPSPCG
jgi:hypothetical protein